MRVLLYAVVVLVVWFYLEWIGLFFVAAVSASLQLVELLCGRLIEQSRSTIAKD